MEKIWEIKDPDQYLNPRKAKRRPPSTPRVEKDPARAYTLSLLFSGAGQSYNDQHGKALAFELLVVVLIVGAVVAAIFHDSLLSFLRNNDVAPSRSFLFAEALFLGLLVFWFSIACDAYRIAARSRSARFTGITNPITPCLCSFLVPGWGQFLNGQPLKGSLFSVVSVFGLFAAVSIPSTLLLWKYLEPSETRFIVEEIFSAAVLYAPIVPLLWLLSGYDAFKVSRDELKKESLWERIKAANNRRRTQGWVQGVFPQFRSTLVLALVLTGLALIITRVFPAAFYLGLLQTLSTALRSQGMTLLPELMDRLVPILNRGSC